MRIERQVVFSIDGNIADDRISPVVRARAGLVANIHAVCAGGFYQGIGFTERLGKRDAIGVGDNAPLQTIIKTLAVFVVAIPRRHFAVRPFIVTVHIAGVTHAIRTVTLLDVPVQRVVLQRDAVHADIMRRSTILAGVHAIAGPRLREEFIQRYADVKRQQLVVGAVIRAVV